MVETESNIYPKFVLKNIEHPSKLLAFPFFGIFIKTILLIPVFVYVYILSIAYAFFFIVLPFYILFTGKYWDTAYRFVKAYYIYSTKITLYYAGLTDKYPGFNLNDGGLFQVNIEKPSHPNRWLAAPIVGFIVRAILTIPYIIYVSILQYGFMVAVFGSWFVVLFRGKYPESFYEFGRDTIRVSLAHGIYMFYLSDKYPSFWISMKHKAIKIVLIILGTLLFLGQTADSFNEGYREQQQNEINNQNFDVDFETPGQRT